ncbi:MAG: 30S ribosomal protein S6 [Spirochaetes bacterium]|uniref:Small ribosomal subunit protein bS6 n=1 Tax=Candidatus Ornithospirochaeta stercoripullorum TaxID=2840899 RepID=A0A9D9DWM4_9SPIO|nr:30S ribosomal protein S6 [Candidatus Ornithospirochaeta stercoripullorum]
MQNYEFTVIFDADEEKTKTGLELVKNTFQRFNVEITKEEDLGVRTLAYVIRKQEKGHYVYFELKADTATIANMSRIFQLSTLVLKFLFVNPERK